MGREGCLGGGRVGGEKRSVKKTSRPQAALGGNLGTGKGERPEERGNERKLMKCFGVLLHFNSSREEEEGECHRQKKERGKE